jgi:hypothetical protein
MIKLLSLLTLFTFIVTACKPQPTKPVNPTETSPAITSPSTYGATSTPKTATATPKQTSTATETIRPRNSAPTETASPGVRLQPLIGIHIDKLSSPKELNLFKSAGAYWTRFDGFHWDKLEPVKAENPSYQWGEVDESTLMNVANTGAQIIGMVQFAPDWAQKYPGVACGAFAKTALDDFASFMHALVSRYSQPPYNIKYWEIGNEPDIDHNYVEPHSGFGCWGDQGDPYYGGGYYAEMLKATFDQVKSADPQAKLLVGGLLLDCDPLNPPETSPNSDQYKNCASSRFLEGILKNGGGNYFDGVSFHAYDYYGNQVGKYANPNWHSAWNTSGPVLIAKASYLRSVLADYGYSDKLLLNTELALLCGRDGTEAPCHAQDFELTKANSLTQANAAALAPGLSANIWYSLTGWRASGLVDRSLKPSLAYEADQFSADQLKGAAFVAELTDLASVKGYEFNKDGKQMWLLWSLDGEKHTIQLPTTPDHVFDALGKALPTATEITITATPIYLEWETQPG